ncbi:uncharacterized protein [Macrobrachium rosenbergii]|uniref:uncharacterized protein isoform X2 n=1 Tax=Macrobrachium rosenbergii TaxID=79674 RepID=UPI0034D532EA
MLQVLQEQMRWNHLRQRQRILLSHRNLQAWISPQHNCILPRLQLYLLCSVGYLSTSFLCCPDHNSRCCYQGKVIDTAMVWSVGPMPTEKNK